MGQVGIINIGLEHWGYIQYSSPYLIPEHYGAKGGGIIDDTLALQACFNAAVSMGKSVFLSKMYGTTGNLSVPSFSHIKGNASSYSGTGGAGLKLISGANDILINSDPVSGNQHIILEDFYISGNAVVAGAGTGIKFTKTNRCRIHNIRLNKIGAQGFYFDGCKENELLNLQGMNIFGDGIYFNGTSDSFIQHSNLTSKARGIYLGGSSANNIVSGNTIYLCGTYGIMIQANRNVVCNNRSNTNVKSGIYIYACNRNTVNNNECYDNGTGGAGLCDGIDLGGAATYNVLIGNSSSNNLGVTQPYGIKISDAADYNICRLNQLYQNASGGIIVVGTGVNNVITDNIP
jgi:parallel beta-helix repeat protein